MNPAPIKPLISTSDLDEIDVRVGTILVVEGVAHSEKLVRLRVDFGDHARSILVGMKKERPSPKEIEGRQALFLYKCAKDSFDTGAEGDMVVSALQGVKGNLLDQCSTGLSLLR
jgi:tRNA-binding protein